MDLADRVVLITGGRRLSAGVALAVAERGADVAVTYRSNRAGAEETADAVRARGRRAVALEADVSRDEDCHRLLDTVGTEFGRLDVLVNTASIYKAVPLDQMDAAAWDRQLAVDLRGTFLCSLAAVPLLRQSGGGRIINFSDWVAASARPRYTDYVAYYVAKAGVKALGEALALELAASNILVNTIAPGPAMPPEDTEQHEVDAVIRATPLGRWGGPEEIAKAVLALIDSDFITGETIRVDGGRHVR